MSGMREQLEQLVEEMVTKGIRYEDALREFEKRFIAQVIVKADGNLCKAADLLGIHRNTLSRKIAEHRIRRSWSIVLFALGSVGPPFGG
jgi:Fis family transcriptional regulator, factor for inversion stimulation protein